MFASSCYSCCWHEGAQMTLLPAAAWLPLPEEGWAPGPSPGLTQAFGAFPKRESYWWTRGPQASPRGFSGKKAEL